MHTVPVIECVMFDLDGTLIDSLADLANATNYMLTSLGRPPATMEHVRGYVGQGARRLVERAMPGASPAEIQEGLVRFLAFNEEHIVQQTRLYPGAIEVLQKLRAAGITLAVVSNKNTVLCRKVLNILAAGEYFACVIGADTLVERKPSPVPLFKAMADCGSCAARSVIVGDSINDIAAGKAAGVTTVGCTFGYGDLSELADADYRVNSLPQLLQLPLFSF